MLPRADIPIGLTIINFMNFAGGTIFISVCQAILASTLTHDLREEIPGLDVAAVLGHGAADLIQQVQPDQVPILLAAYSHGIDNIMYTAMAVLILAFLASWFVEWRSVKEPRGKDVGNTGDETTDETRDEARRVSEV